MNYYNSRVKQEKENPWSNKCVEEVKIHCPKCGVSFVGSIVYYSCPIEKCPCFHGVSYNV